MVYVIIGMGLFFVALGFIVNVKNARYLLSGYNTMSEENRKKVDIHSLIPYLRKFHIFLGVSLAMIGLLLTWLIGDIAGGILLAVYPVVAYMFFILDSRRFSKELKHQWHWVAVSVLGVVLIFVSVLFVLALREDKLLVTEEAVILEGNYGQQIPGADIQSIALVQNIPPLATRTNGFAMGSVLKGYFKTRDGEIVKLILNSDQKPFILITLDSGEKIYYASKQMPAESIYAAIQREMPKLDFDQ